MGIGDYVDKAKHALAGREEQVAGALDKAADAVKSRTSPGTDRKIDSAVDKAKDFLSKQADGHRDTATPNQTGAPDQTGTHSTHSTPDDAPGATHPHANPGPTPTTPGRHADSTDTDRPGTTH